MGGGFGTGDSGDCRAGSVTYSGVMLLNEGVQWDIWRGDGEGLSIASSPSMFSRSCDWLATWVHTSIINHGTPRPALVAFAISLCALFSAYR